jgi:hypothetical protein
MVEAVAKALAKEYYRGYVNALIDQDLELDDGGEDEESYAEEHWRDWVLQATKAIPPMFHTTEPDWEV